MTPGTRALVFITAGIHAVRISSFLRYDIMGAAVWVPAMLIAGHAAGRHLGDLQAVLDRLNRGALWAGAAAALLLVMWMLLGREESKL